MKKILKLSSVLTLLLFVFTACDNNYIDPISNVDPGSDAEAPLVTMTFPTDGGEVNAAADVSNVKIQFEVTDDIEIASVSVQLDGTTLATYSDFLDYRRLVAEISKELGLGAHLLVITATDLSGKNTVKTINFTKINTIRDLMNEAIFYMDFNSDYVDNVSAANATVVGTPSIETTDVVDGSGAYKGAADAYLTYPTTGLLSNEFSAAMFYKMDPSSALTPENNRAGILVIRPPLINGTDNDLTKGFCFFRENAGSKQRFKVNAGSGATGNWFDGGAAADVDPNINDWIHLAFTISGTEIKVYINGQVVKQGSFTGIDWSNCTIMSIMSGAPNFTQWNHWSDWSDMDELLIYDRVLTQDEINLLGLLLP